MNGAANTKKCLLKSTVVISEARWFPPKLADHEPVWAGPDQLILIHANKSSLVQMEWSLLLSPGAWPSLFREGRTTQEGSILDLGSLSMIGK